jgi:soluble lytic murein transglycosylase-like protein
VRYALTEAVTRLGRGPDNDVVIEGADAASVSLHHLEIRREGSGFRIHDLDSTNGTFVDGQRVSECELAAPAAIRLGTQGPEFSFQVDEPAVADLDRTMVLPRESVPEPAAPAPLRETIDHLLADAVERAREARAKGIPDQTMTIMRDTLRRAVRHSSRHFHAMIWILVAGLLAVSGVAAWQIRRLDRQKASIDQQIREVEKQLQQSNAAEADRLMSELSAYEGEAQRLERSLLYRWSARSREDYVTAEVRTLLTEFGAEVYSVPPEFIDRVKIYIDRYTGPDRPLIEQALTEAAPLFDTIRQILEEQHLPPDLAYIPVVEGAVKSGEASAAGAAGPWQLTAATAKALGLRIDGEVDERKNLRKSTLAACRYLRNLILDFGSGSSVMLALAAYNSGPTKVKQAVMNTVRDPIKQRNFWYLYRVRALPEETREYVPKVFAVMIVGRNPRHFGIE